MAVALIPAATLKVALNRPNDAGDDVGLLPCEARRGVSRILVENPLRMRPECGEHSILAVRWYEHRLEPWSGA